MWHDYSRICSGLMIGILLAPQVFALVPNAPFSQILVSRQAGTGGTACTSACAVFTNAINGCSTTSCLCNNNVANGLQSCINCAVTTSPTSEVIASAQGLISTYGAACAGINTPVVTIPAGSNGGGVSTSKSVAISSPSVGSTTATATKPSTTFTPTTSTSNLIQSPTSTAIVISSVVAISTPSIVQTTVFPSTVIGPASGPSASTAVVQSGAISKSAPGIMALGLHVVLGCILSAFVAL